MWLRRNFVDSQKRTWVFKRNTIFFETTEYPWSSLNIFLRLIFWWLSILQIVIKKLFRFIITITSKNNHNRICNRWRNVVIHWVKKCCVLQRDVIFFLHSSLDIVTNVSKYPIHLIIYWAKSFYFRVNVWLFPPVNTHWSVIPSNYTMTKIIFFFCDRDKNITMPRLTWRRHRTSKRSQSYIWLNPHDQHYSLDTFQKHLNWKQ